MWVQTLINILPQILFCCQLHHIILDGVIVVLDCMFLWFSYKFALLWQICLRFPNFLYQLQPRYLPYHDTLVGRVMPKFCSNKFFLNDSHQCSYHNDLKIGLFVGYFLMGWVLIRAGVYCPHLWAQLVFIGCMATWTKNPDFSWRLDCVQCGDLRRLSLWQHVVPLVGEDKCFVMTTLSFQ